MSAEDTQRRGFFGDVYREAAGDAASVPWADLKPKAELVEWLTRNPGGGRAAIDVACGLGDNAEAIAAAGWRTTAFDLAADAISWAGRRFPDSPVDYRVADVLDPPPHWRGGFDLVNECYTLQAVPPEAMPALRAAVAALVAPGGRLLVYARVRPDGSPASGPPWPLEISQARAFADMGFELVSERRFETVRRDRLVDHVFCEWKRAEAR